MVENQIMLATELMKGQVVKPCVTTEGICPLLDINEGCTAEGGLRMGVTGIECPEGKGNLIITSERLQQDLAPAQEVSLV